MSKRLLTTAALATALLTGCATSVSRSVQYDGSNADFAISISKKSGAVADQIELLVDGDTVANGSVSMVNPSTLISATVQDNLIEAQCSAVQTGGLSTGLNCEIYVDGEDYGLIKL